MVIEHTTVRSVNAPGGNISLQNDNYANGMI